MPNNHRQNRTSHALLNVLPLGICAFPAFKSLSYAEGTTQWPRWSRSVAETTFLLSHIGENRRTIKSHCVDLILGLAQAQPRWGCTVSRCINGGRVDIGKGFSPVFPLSCDNSSRRLHASVVPTPVLFCCFSLFISFPLFLVHKQRSLFLYHKNRDFVSSLWTETNMATTYPVLQGHGRTGTDRITH